MAEKKSAQAVHENERKNPQEKTQQRKKDEVAL